MERDVHDGRSPAPSIDDALDEPAIGVARTKQPIRRSAAHVHIPLVAIPSFSPPIARRAPRARTRLDASPTHAATIDGHVLWAVVTHTYARRDSMRKTTKSEDGLLRRRPQACILAQP